MPWVRATFRGKTVYAHTTEAGALDAKRGLVEIRYKLGDARAYHARADGLVVADPAPLPESAFPDGVKPEAAKPAPRPPREAAALSGTVPIAPPLDGTTIIAYTDGACTGNPGPAGLGVIVVDGAHTTELSEFLGEATNNIAELTAILRALEAVADKARPLVIHTDSQYAIGVLSKGWKAKANSQLIATIKSELAGRPRVSFVYVRGHAGVPLNERADELAREAVQNRTRRRAEARAGGVA